MELLGYTALGFGVALLLASIVVSVIGFIYSSEVRDGGSLGYALLGLLLSLAAKAIFWRFGYRISPLDIFVAIPILLAFGIILRRRRR